ncbi:MAG: hypothetical protein ABSG33_08845 [Candidatus Bathyarchaeia archaeon]
MEHLENRRGRLNEKRKSTGRLDQAVSEVVDDEEEDDGVFSFFSERKRALSD